MASAAGGGAAGPTVEKVIAEAFVKSAEIILASRIYGPRTSTEQSRGRAWFNLEVEEVDGASKALERWRRETGLPLVVEVFLQPWGAQAVAGGQQDKVETLLERWVVHYYPMLPEGPSHLSRSQLSRLNPASVYKRLVITLRSLYTYVRVLPAYRMYRACKRQRGSNFTIGYRLHSTLPGRSAAAAPGSRRMQSFKFGAVDTPYGQFRIAVDYQPASTVTILEQTTSPPPLPQIIADYVGGSSGGAGRVAAAAAAHGRGGGGVPLRHAMSASVFGPSLPPTVQAASPPQQQQLGSSPQSSSAGAGAGGAQGGQPGSAGMPIIRRSWSTSLRGASPQRLGPLSQPSSELPSPVSAQETPYGSAPVSLPAMLRALSSGAARGLAVGSPSGRPPLAKPPRPGTTGRAASSPGDVLRQPTAAGSGAPGPPPPPLSAEERWSAAVRGGAAEASLLQGNGEEDEGSAEGSDSGSPRSGSSKARQSSAPMSIPGRGFGPAAAGGAGGAGRRLRSSGDLWALQQAAAMHKPLSAPAVSHMRPAGAAAMGAAGAGSAGAAAGAVEPTATPTPSPAEPSPVGSGPSTRVGSGGGSSGGGMIDHPLMHPSPPSASAATRLAPIPGTLDSESSGGSASASACSSSVFPTSCSPQLPFAFTPSAQSLSSFGARGPLQDSMRLERTSPRLGRTLSSASTGQPQPGSSSSSPAHQQRPTSAAVPLPAVPAAAAAAAAAGFSPGSGGVTGREVPASRALMRRPSWSSRSSSLSYNTNGNSNALGAEGLQPGVGYSVSPMQDPVLESMLAGSTPRQFSLAAGSLPSAAGQAQGSSAGGTAGTAAGTSPLNRMGSAVPGYGAAAVLPMLTFPAVPGDPALGSGLDEADVLPFALDEGTASPLKPRSPATVSAAQPPGAGYSVPSPTDQLPVSTPAGGVGSPHPTAACDVSVPAGRGAAAAAPAQLQQAAVDTDAAVGAFVRLIQDAPPLRLHTAPLRPPTRAASADMGAALQGALPSTSSCSDSSGATCLSDGRGLTLQAGLRHFDRIKQRLHQRGITFAPCPAEV